MSVADGNVRLDFNIKSPLEKYFTAWYLEDKETRFVRLDNNIINVKFLPSDTTSNNVDRIEHTLTKKLPEIFSKKNNSDYYNLFAVIETEITNRKS